MPMLRPAHPCIHRDPKRKDCHVISDGTLKHGYVRHATPARHGSWDQPLTQPLTNNLGLWQIMTKNS